MDIRQNRILIFLWTAITLLYSDVACIQYAPIELTEYPDCAVIVTNPQEYPANSSHSDSDGAVNCITYDAINQAYLDAIRRIDVTPIGDDPPLMTAVAAIGEVILDVSRQLAEMYNLNQEDIELGLANVDITKTAIRDICPAYLSSIRCHAGKYRRYDGLCNNLDHPSWGATNTIFPRLIPPQFADHINAPRESISGNPLPSARIVSRTIHPDEGYHDHAGTIMVIAWGQFCDHDFSLMGMPADPINLNEPMNCCDTPPSRRNPFCFEIEVPDDDYFYRKFNVKCQDFVRSFPGIRPDCKLGSRNPFNTLPSVMDGNTVYGSTDTVARSLRTGFGGLLRMNAAFTQFGLKDLLPPKTDIPDQGCLRTDFSQYCFLAGEIRVNEQLILACIHTLMAREHNRIAKELAELNPHWEDEIVYQETRRIVIAEIQHITFHEFLPVLLGKDVMEKFGLLLSSKGFWDGYNPKTNPGITDAFAAAAFRFGHSLLPTTVERWSKAHKFIASRRLSNLIRQPYDLYRAGVIDEYYLGLLNQVAQAMDDSVTQEVTNNLFKRPGERFGLDLIAFNIQRGREFGLPAYMYYREYCGLKTAYTFDELISLGIFANSTVQRYATIYESPWDIDLWSGGAAELSTQGSLVGPTFACIIATQMKRIRQGDRFWYELPDQPSSFTLEQLQEIRKVKLAKIMCDNTDLIETIQLYPMILPDVEFNPRIPCKSSILPSMDLSLWRETPSVEEVLGDNVVNHTVYVNETVPSPPNQTSSEPSAYEYHIKTVAIIEGANPSINLNDLLNPSLPDNHLSPPQHENDHLRPRRSVNDTSTVVSSASKAKNTTEDATPSPSNRVENVTSSSNSSAAAKDLTKRKRSFYPGRSLNLGRTRPQPEMTQAIIKETSEPSYERRSFDHSSNVALNEDDEQHNIEDFFRKNVPIYDGVPIARRGYHRSSSAAGGGVSPKKYYHFSPSPQDDEGEEEEDGKPMKGLLEVHPDPDMEHEYVPMTIDEFGKQVVMEEEEAAEEEDEPSSYPHPTAAGHYRHNGGGYSDDDSPYHGRPFASPSPSFPSSHPYRFENSYSAPFKPSTYSYRPSSFSAGPTPPTSHTKYGTSHQYNSLADQQPRYYKHFKPSIPYPAHDEVDYSSPSYTSYSAASRPVEYSGRSTYPNNHDFVPKRGPPSSSSGIRGAYASKYPARSTHVPQTLEEYHRIHGTFDTSNKKSAARPYSRPIVVPQDDEKKEEEEEEEEKDKDTADFTHAPKSFVTLNFGTTGTSGESNDDGVSVRHEIGHHFKRRKPYFRPAASAVTEEPSYPFEDHREFQVEYPSDTISGSAKYANDESSPEAIKSFVDSVFKQNSNYDGDVVVGKKSNLVSQFNPHYGERVKQRASGSTQDLLWHRKGSGDSRVARDKQSRDKNDRLVQEENIKMYDSLVREVTMKPAKRDANAGTTQQRSEQTVNENKDEYTPQETQPKQDEAEPEDEEEPQQYSYWSQSSSEPN